MKSSNDMHRVSMSIFILLLAILVVNGCKSTNREVTTPKPIPKRNIFVWKTKQQCGPNTYFFGTVHVPIYKIWKPDTSRYGKRTWCIGSNCFVVTEVWQSIPEEIKILQNQCDDVFTELPMDDHTAQLASDCFKMENGKNLSDILSPGMYSKVEAHIDYLRDEVPKLILKDDNLQYRLMEKRIPVETFSDFVTKNMHKLRPFSFIVQAELLRNPETVGVGLERLLSQHFYWSGWSGKAGIETVQEQCDAVNHINDMPEVITLLENWLTQMEIIRKENLSIKSEISELVKSYSNGDAEAVEYLTQTAGSSFTYSIKDQDTPIYPMNETEKQAVKKIMEMVQQRLLFNRNYIMGKRVVEIMRKRNNTIASGGTVLDACFVFGVGHFLGYASVLDYVRSQGFELINVKTEAEIKNHMEYCNDTIR